jgi:tetratricopeptide (TPR) repeat protein
LKYAAARIAGKIAASAKKTEDALAMFELAMQDRREFSDDLYEDIGGMYFDAENFAKAAEWYRKAVNDPATKNKPQYLYRLSQVEELGGNTEAALAALKQALDQLPEVPLLHFQQGWIYYHAKRYDEAIQKFDEVVTKYSQDKEIVRRCLFLLSTLYVQKGDLRKGEVVLEYILAEEQDDPSVNNDLGFLYADHCKYLEQAKSMIQKAVKAEPENPAYLDSMGWVLYKLGDYQEAVPYLEKAVKLPRGGDSTIWDHLGDCYARLKQMDKAKDAWQKALDDAKADAKPDEKLIKRIEQKLAGADTSEGPDLP